jgi:hypothetical protein
MPNSDALGIFIIAALLAIGGGADAQRGAAPGVRPEAKPGAAVVANRIGTLKGPEGGTRALKLDPSVKRLAEVKKGDQVVARRSQALALSVSMP